MNIIIRLKTIHIGEESGRGSGRVGSGRVRLCAGNRGSGRVGSGQRSGGSGRVGSKKSDPWTTLGCCLPTLCESVK